ncbi:MAG: hypothetical protein ACD_33C00002G0028 [uncultured bacterium]|nr:MAG: hypothetical protein ACD_33C00002G0028 [uncultured bacterium]
MANFKTKFCWLPVRLVRHNPLAKEDNNEPKLEIIGWTWLKKVPLVKNVNIGWVHVLDSKPYEYTCPACGQKVIT